MKMKNLFILVILMATAGCASTPIRTDLPAVVGNPEQYKNKRIEVTGLVIENPPPQGDEYRTWTFVLGSPQSYRVSASEDGFNPSTIEKAYRLVEEARNAGEEVTVTGKLRVGPYQAIESGMEIELDSVRYRGTIIRTDRGPFIRRYYYPSYPYFPYYYYGPYYYPRPYFLHGHFHYYH